MQIVPINLVSYKYNISSTEQNILFPHYLQKRSAGGEVKDWYERKDYGRIEYYIKDEAARFIHAYKFLKQRLPELHRLYEPLP